MNASSLDTKAIIPLKKKKKKKRKRRKVDNPMSGC